MPNADLYRALGRSFDRRSSGIQKPPARVPCLAVPPLLFAMYCQEGDARQRAALVEEEHKLRLALCSIRTQMNRHIPIACLPLDVLERIFTCCLRDAHHTKHPLAFTQVCSFWRKEALNDTRLWSVIDLSRNKNWISHFISRSRHTSLKFIGHIPPNDRRIRHLPALAHRVNTLDISFNSPFSQDFLVELASTPSWSSENVSIKCTPADPHTTLDICCSSVHNLSLQNVSVPWDTHCPNLRQLSLSNLPREHAPSLSQLHAWMQSSRQELRSISLQHVEMPEADIAGLDPIEMPNLQTIFVACSPEVIKGVLGLLRTIPSHAQITISAYYSLQPLHSLAQLLPSSQWSPLTSPPPRSLEFTSSELIIDHGRLRAKLHPLAKRVFALGAGLNKTVPLRDVNTVVLGKNFLRKITQDELQGVFEDLNDLHTLVVSDGNEIDDLLSLFAWRPDICPMLRVLRFEDIAEFGALSATITKLLLARKGVKVVTNACADLQTVNVS